MKLARTRFLLLLVGSIACIPALAMKPATTKVPPSTTSVTVDVCITPTGGAPAPAPFPTYTAEPVSKDRSATKKAGETLVFKISGAQLDKIGGADVYVNGVRSNALNAKVGPVVMEGSRQVRFVTFATNIEKEGASIVYHLNIRANNLRARPIHSSQLTVLAAGIDSRVQTQSGLRVQIAPSTTRQTPDTSFGAIMKRADAEARTKLTRLVAQARHAQDVLARISQEKMPGNLTEPQRREFAAQSKWLHATANRLAKFTADAQAVLNNPSASAKDVAAVNEQLLALQNSVQENRQFTVISNVLKVRHDVASSAIHNIR